MEQAGFEVITGSNKSGTATDKTGGTQPVDMVLTDVQINDYGGIFFIGGPGALENLDNEESYRVIKEAAGSGKPWGAICISPRILANAGVLASKHATGWNGDNELPEILFTSGAIYVREPVVVDGMLITAEGPAAAREFGRAIVSALQ